MESVGHVLAEIKQSSCCCWDRVGAVCFRLFSNRYNNPGRQRAEPSEFETVIVPRFFEQKKNCVVCYEREKAETKGLLLLYRPTMSR